MELGKNTIDFMANQIKDLLYEYENDITEACVKSEDGSLSIGMSIKVSPGDIGFKIETGINFVTGRVKDKSVGMVGEG